MSILRVARWRSARDMIKWLCNQERFGTCKSQSYFERYLATAELQLAKVMMMRIQIIQRLARGRLVPTPACRKLLFHIAPYGPSFAKCSKFCQLFRALCGHALFVREGDVSVFSVGPLGSRRGYKVGSDSMGWLFWNLMAHPLLGEEDTMLSPHWL
jgi:hypothetical protein